MWARIVYRNRCGRTGWTVVVHPGLYVGDAVLGAGTHQGFGDLGRQHGSVIFSHPPHGRPHLGHPQHR